MLRDLRVVQTLPLKRQRELPIVASDERKKLANALSEIFLKSRNQDSRAYAAYFIGEYQLVGATSALLSNISFKDTKYRTEREGSALWYWGQRPAAEALVKLADAAVPSLLDAITNETEISRRRLLLATLSSIYSDDKEVVILILKRPLKVKKPPLSNKRRVNLETSIKLYSSSSPGSLWN